MLGLISLASHTLGKRLERLKVDEDSEGATKMLKGFWGMGMGRCYRRFWGCHLALARH